MNRKMFKKHIAILAAVLFFTFLISATAFSQLDGMGGAVSSVGVGSDASGVGTLNILWVPPNIEAK
jgi:hypothetical protein